MHFLGFLLVAVFCVDEKFLIKKVGYVTYMFKVRTVGFANIQGICMPPDYTDIWTYKDENLISVEDAGTDCLAESPSSKDDVDVGDTFVWLYDEDIYDLEVEGGLKKESDTVYFSLNYIVGNCDDVDLIWAIFNGSKAYEGEVEDCTGTFKSVYKNVQALIEEDPGSCEEQGFYQNGIYPCFPSYTREVPAAVVSLSCEESTKSSICFSTDSELELVDGSRVMLKDAKAGDKVLTFDEETKSVKETEIIDVVIHSFSSRTIKKVVYEISSEEERSLYITDNHYLFFTSSEEDDMIQVTSDKNKKLAAHLNVGDYILSKNEENQVSFSKVIRIENVASEMGTVYTKDGKVFVDGVLASSYSLTRVRNDVSILSQFEVFAQKIWYHGVNLWTGGLFRNMMIMFVENVWHKMF